ncbi:site-specific recombinase, phage integrase family [Bacteriovorax sp. BAL6_X]|uniref:site-specific integrase n=1 Tax=Bacteriovorax sp. BAL6_X TaxID=1201290 RepID=UPI000386184A|nr:site-specific integrase [Bacteriovorax sp. BAL6_X]EPZ51851.1 site-specific recombinase, phage integrase family [Bacteriovorax sp. BAL6_X]
MSKKQQKRENMYIPVPSCRGICKHKNTGNYQATKTIRNKTTRRTFESLRQAKNWLITFNGVDEDQSQERQYASLKEVWDSMQKHHFPTLAKSTKTIWLRRYQLLKTLEHLPMNLITRSKVRSWVEENVEYFKSDFYEGSSRGKAKRCNLDNELNLFTTIFNWYQKHELYEQEAKFLINPVRTEHKKLGIIRPKPVRDMNISVEECLRFFEHLNPLYRDLAMFQYLTASRIGEIAGLQWHRVDFSRNKATIMETCYWDNSSKTFVSLNDSPKNKEPRPFYLTPILKAILLRRQEDRFEGSNFVFHVNGKPLNYGTIQKNYRQAQRRAGIPHSGTHILRHGMAKLARKIGGGLDAVIAMTGHKDFKLADHYSKLDEELNKEVSLKVTEEIKKKMIELGYKDEALPIQNHYHNVIPLSSFRVNQGNQLVID